MIAGPSEAHAQPHLPSSSVSFRYGRQVRYAGQVRTVLCGFIVLRDMYQQARLCTAYIGYQEEKAARVMGIVGSRFVPVGLRYSCSYSLFRGFELSNDSGNGTVQRIYIIDIIDRGSFILPIIPSPCSISIQSHRLARVTSYSYFHFSVACCLCTVHFERYASSTDACSPVS